MPDLSPKLDYEPAKIFNDLQKDLGARISTCINHLLVLDAGVLSITIGAFLGLQPPWFAPDALVPVRAGWWLLTIAFVSALTAAFCVLLAQSLLQDTVRSWYIKKLQDPAMAGWKVCAGPSWFRTRSEAGKAGASRNAWKGGNREMLRELGRTLHGHRELLSGKLDTQATQTLRLSCAAAKE